MLNSASCAYVCDVCVSVRAYNVMRFTHGETHFATIQDDLRRGQHRQPAAGAERLASAAGGKNKVSRPILRNFSRKFYNSIPRRAQWAEISLLCLNRKKNVKRENKPSEWSWILGLGKRTTDRVISENDFDVEQASRSDLIPYELHWLRCIWSCPDVAAVCFALLGDVFDGSHEMTRFSKVPSALLMFWCSPSTTTTADAWQTYNLGL